jgi:hypothetical protein
VAVECEFACLEGQSRHGARVCERGHEALSLVVSKPEGFVSPDRPPNRTSKCVADIRILGHYLSCRVDFVIEEVARTQGIVATEPVHVGVKLVGASFGHDIHHCSCVAAELRQGVARDDAKFLNGIWIQGGEPGLRLRQAGNLSVVVVGTVEQKIVISFARAIHGDSSEDRVALSGARRQQGQLIGVSQNQWQILDLLPRDGISDLCVIQIERGDQMSADCHFLLNATRR